MNRNQGDKMNNSPQWNSRW